MSVFNAAITRDAGTDALVPEPVVAQIIQGMPQFSSVLTLARRVPMSSRTTRQPVLSALPTAYFVTAETGTSALKQTTNQDWENVVLTAEEMAVIVPIPEAYFDDAMVPIWDEVRPRMAEALGTLIDAACLFGVSKPSTWSPAIYQTSVLKGNHSNSVTDLGVAVARAGEELAKDGFSVNGFAARPGLHWNLVGMRDTTGQPIYVPSVRGSVGPTGDLYGFPLQEVKSGGWNSTEANLIVGDWSMAVVGMRQDITFRVFTEGVISNAAGDVVLNLMQQDHIALRMVMRMGFATANPVTRLNTNAATRYPFYTIRPNTGYTYS
jgi:HK97 family phage major capsid protein